MSQSNQVKNVIIVGASGNVGTYIVDSLQEKGGFNISALTRSDTTNTFKEGLNVIKVDYDDNAALVDALQGADVLIISLAVTAPRELQPRIIRAAAEAKVPWVLPNEWGVHTNNPQIGKDVLIGPKMEEDRALISELGASSWIGVCCSFWYEWSVGMNKVMYGFDLKNRGVTFYGDGNVPINTSTWPQVGRAVAQLLSLPITASDGSPSLSDFKNDFLYITSFKTTQKDMFESLKRVTKTTDNDWTIAYEDPKERFEAGQKQLFGGDRMGFGKLLYARMFFSDEPINFARHYKISNNVLGLPTEDMDEATQNAIDLNAKTGGWGN